MSTSKKKDIWNQIIGALGSKLHKGEVKTWFSRTSLRKFDTTVAVIDVPNKFVANWLSEHYLTDLKKTFTRKGRYPVWVTSARVEHDALMMRPRHLYKFVLQFERAESFVALFFHRTFHAWLLSLLEVMRLHTACEESSRTRFSADHGGIGAPE